MGKDSLCNKQDISKAEIKRLEEIVEKQNAKIFQLSSILWDAPGSIYWKDANGKYLGHNLAAAEIMKSVNLDWGNIVGKTDYDLFPKAVADEFRKNDLEVMSTKCVKKMEEITKLANGVEVIQLSIKKPLFDGAGNVVGVVGITIDITDSKKIERLKQEKEIAEKLADFATSIAGSIAHEMKHPLAGINLQLDILSGELASANLPPEKIQSCASIIKMSKQAIKGAVHVISDMLLKIKSFATGKVQYDSFVKTSISSDIDAILDTFPFDENEKELIELKNFEKISSRFQYLGDTTFTQHVLSNLLRNALYAVRIENKGKIIIELQSGKPFNKLIFRDTAGSLSKETAAKIFNHFESKKGHSGTGLGLSFCKMVMQEYGGNIECNVEEGKFTEFVLSFPAL